MNSSHKDKSIAPTYVDGIDKLIQDMILEGKFEQARHAIEGNTGRYTKTGQESYNSLVSALKQSNLTLFQERKSAADNNSTPSTDGNTTPCKTCGGIVSKFAQTCPHCGEQLPSQKTRCPKCNSLNIKSGTKGFGLGKAVAGAVVLGPGGLLAGLHGRKNMEFQCLSCGKKWNPKK
jgi:predicted RNA-binding Zn-ribbon protein involved in translation (DUF1610 family)